MECPHCGYDWKPNVEKPKRCPNCKRVLAPPELQQTKRLERSASKLPQLELVAPIRGTSIVTCKLCPLPAMGRIHREDGTKDTLCKEHMASEVLRWKQLSFEDACQQVSQALEITS